MSTTVEGRSIWCYFGETCGYHSRLEGCSVCPGDACLCQLLTDNLLPVYNFFTKVHYACQKRHVCLGSHLTKPCLSCVVTSKTAAIHVRCQHSMCNFLSCKILQGPHPTAWDQEGLPFSLPDAYWSIKESHTPFTMHHPMHLPNKCIPSIYMPCTFQQPSLVSRLFFWNKTTMHLPFTYICHAHPTG